MGGEEERERERGGEREREVPAYLQSVYHSQEEQRVKTSGGKRYVHIYYSVMLPRKKKKKQVLHRKLQF